MTPAAGVSNGAAERTERALQDRAYLGKAGGFIGYGGRGREAAPGWNMSGGYSAHAQA